MRPFYLAAIFTSAVCAAIPPTTGANMYVLKDAATTLTIVDNQPAGWGIGDSIRVHHTYADGRSLDAKIDYKTNGIKGIRGELSIFDSHRVLEASASCQRELLLRPIIEWALGTEQIHDPKILADLDPLFSLVYNKREALSHNIMEKFASGISIYKESCKLPQNNTVASR